MNSEVYKNHSTTTLTDVMVGLVFLLFCTAIQAADSRETEIQRSGELRVCVWPEYFAISYRNSKNGQIQGLDIDMANAFAADLGVKPRLVFTDFGHFIADLQADRCDIGMFGIGRTQSRLKQLDFSQPYMASGMYGITTKTHHQISSWESMDRPDTVVCVQKGTYMEHAMRQMLKHAEISVVNRPYEREAEVRSGRADVFITDYPYGQKVLKHYDWARLLTPTSQSSEKFPYAYAVAKGQPDWLKRVDQFVAGIKQDGRLSKSAEKHGLTPIIY